uniref:Variable surface glycoprotein n=1 Tax=Trypanosoma evansi TaxID=5697 RepID=Q968L7_TRYEV|nr:variable surface glycoprotein [Trypanosoma evansi]
MSVRQWAQFIFVYVLTFRHSEAAEGDALSLEAVKKLCSVTVRTKTTAKDIVAQLKARQGKASELLSLQAKLQLASCAGGGELKDQLAVLSVYVKTKIQEQVSKTEKLAVSGAKRDVGSIHSWTRGRRTHGLRNSGRDGEQALSNVRRQRNKASVARHCNANMRHALTTEGGSAAVSPPYDYSKDHDVSIPHQQPQSGVTLFNTNTRRICGQHDDNSTNVKWAAGLLDIAARGENHKRQKIGTTNDDTQTSNSNGSSHCLQSLSRGSNCHDPEPAEDNYDSRKTDPKLNEAIKMFVLGKAQKPDGTDVASQIEPEKTDFSAPTKKTSKQSLGQTQRFSSSQEVSGKVSTKKISDLSARRNEKAAMVCVLDQKKFSTESEMNCPKHGQIPNAEEVCNAIEDKTTCDNNKQCSYHNKVEDGSKKCRYNATKSTGNGVPAPQTQTGGTETTTDKCKDKKKDECKSPDCKWDGEECKDSSILANKQFALTVVSAAFVALLF